MSVKSRFWPAAVLVLAALAYSPLLRESAFAPSRYGFETALFRPAPMPALLTIAIAAWLVWRRRALAAPEGRALAIALFAVAASASIWAALSRTSDLLFASAATMLLAFGGRAVTLPAGVLLLGLALQRPLEVASALVSVARSLPSLEDASARALVATLPVFTEIEARRTLAAFAAPPARPAPRTRRAGAKRSTRRARARSGRTLP